MKHHLRSIAFAAAVMASCASFAGTVTTLWADDFEWLEPWATWKPIEDGAKPCGDAVGNDEHGSEAKNLVTPYIGSVSEGTAVTVYQALVNKGYDFIATCGPGKSPREAAKQIYLQHNYLKFGLTAYYSGIVIPVENTSENTAYIEFDWCSQRQGSGVFDPTELVVIVKNGDNEMQFPVPFKQYEKDAPLSWTHEKIELTGATLTPDSKVIIRNSDAQWPDESNRALRFYLDNINIYDYSPLDVIAAEDFEWFATEVDGNAIDNCPKVTFDEVAMDEPGKASEWSTSQYFGSYSTGRYLTAYDKMLSMGYEFEYVMAEGKNERNGGTGSVVYIMKDYVKFGLTGYQAGISIPAKMSVDGTATLSFDWCPQHTAKGVYDAVELVVIVRDGSTVKKSFNIPAAGLTDGEPIRWIHVEMPLEGVEINKGDFIEIRNADSQWPHAKALRWYLDNFKLTGIGKGDGEPAFVAPDLYIKGDFNNWAVNESSKLATDNVVSLFNDVAYTYTVPRLSGEILFCTADGKLNFGMGTGEFTYPDEDDKTFLHLVLGEGDTKIAVPELDNAVITLYYSENPAKQPEIFIDGNIPVNIGGDRKAYAYDLSASAAENDLLKVSYKSTDNGKGAALILFPEEGDASVIELPAPVKGQNEATVYVGNIASGSYMWQINITSEIEGDEAKVVYRSPASFMVDNSTNGGVVWIRDVQSPAYGYTVVGYGNAGGFAIYDPEGNLLTDTPIHRNFAGFNANYNRSVWRGDARGDLAVFMDGSAVSSGAWVIDPLNPTAEPYNMFMAPGAIRDQNGIINYDATQIGANGTCIAFQGEGDDTKAFSYLWNLYTCTLVRYDLGSAKYITEAPSLVMSKYVNAMANQNIEVEALSEGFFVSQIRNDFNSNVPGLMYFNDEGVKVWDIINTGVIGDTAGHGISSGVAVNADETRLALSGYNEIYVFDLEFDASGSPVLSNAEIYPIAAVNPGSYGMQLVFDAAENLHVFSTCGMGYTVIALPGETTASTPGKDMLTLNTTGLNEINADKNAPVEFFNLQGFRVDGNTLVPGIYIRRQGNTASKVIVK